MVVQAYCLEHSKVEDWTFPLRPCPFVVKHKLDHDDNDNNDDDDDDELVNT